VMLVESLRSVQLNNKMRRKKAAEVGYDCKK